MKHLLFSFLILLLAACGGDKKNSSTPKPLETTQPEPQPEPQPDPSAEQNIVRCEVRTCYLKGTYTEDLKLTADKH